MNLILAQYKASVLSLSRNPGYFIGSMVFPAVFFLFFVPSSAPSTLEANFAMGSFMIFAMMGALFFGFAVGIANDRASAWAVYERTLPGSPYVRLVSRVLNGFTFAGGAVVVMALVAHLTTPAHLSVAAWGRVGPGFARGGHSHQSLGLCYRLLRLAQGSRDAGPTFLPTAFLRGWVVGSTPTLARSGAEDLPVHPHPALG